MILNELHGQSVQSGMIGNLGTFDGCPVFPGLSRAVSPRIPGSPSRASGYRQYSNRQITTNIYMFVGLKLSTLTFKSHYRLSIKAIYILQKKFYE